MDERDGWTSSLMMREGIVALEFEPTSRVKK